MGVKRIVLRVDIDGECATNCQIGAGRCDSAQDIDCLELSLGSKPGPDCPLYGKRGMAVLPTGWEVVK